MCNEKNLRGRPGCIRQKGQKFEGWRNESAKAGATFKNAKDAVVRATASAAEPRSARSVIADASPAPHPHGRIRARRG